MSADAQHVRASRRDGRGWEIAGLIGLAIFAITAVVILDDYGDGIDGPKNAREGAAHLTYLLTGDVDEGVIREQLHGAPVFMLADAAKRLLHDRWRLLDPVTARHAVLPVLLIPFALVLLRFVSRVWGPPVGFFAVALLLTYPRFFGHAFHNLKDVPELITFSLAMMACADWLGMGRREAFPRTFLWWGMALAIKLYALLVPVLLGLWCVIERAVSRRWPRALRGISGRRWGSGLSLSALMVAAFYAPAWWGLGDKAAWFSRWTAHITHDSFSETLSWNLYAFSQLAYATPVPMLVVFLIGVAWVWGNRRATPLNRWLLVWLAVPLLIPCLPRVARYDELRHFLVVLVPLAIVAAQGVCAVVAWLARRSRMTARCAHLVVGAIVLGTNVSGVIATHPYQTAFFNTLVGGLRGAQARQIPSACDYWMTSYREASGWLAIRLPEGATVFAQRPQLLQQYDGMRFLRIDDVYAHVRDAHIPPQTYVLLIPKLHWKHLQRLEDDARLARRLTGCREIHRISRQGGVIASIYDCRAENDPPTPNS